MLGFELMTQRQEEKPNYTRVENMPALARLGLTKMRSLRGLHDLHGLEWLGLA